MNKKVINLIKLFNHLSPYTIDELFEYFDDNEFLTEKGKKFKSAFWKLLIKEDVE